MRKSLLAGTAALALLISACGGAGEGAGGDEQRIRVALGDIESVETLALFEALERVREEGVEVEETYFIRSHLESVATGLAAQRITDAELAELDVLMTKMDDAVAAQDGPAFSDLNQTFHRTIVGCCGNDMLRELTMDIWQRHSGFQRVFRKVPRRLATSQNEHRGIVAALRRHDADEAARLALLHKLSVRDDVSTLVDDTAPAVAGSFED